MPPRQPFTADKDACSVVARVGDVPLAVAIDLFVDEGTERTGRCEAVANVELPDVLHKRREKSLIDRPFDIDAIDAVAELSGIGEGMARNRRRGAFQIGIRADDGRALAAEFEGDALHGRRSRSRHDGLAGGCAAGKRHLARNRMLDHGHADVAPLSGHDVEASGRKARFVKQAGQHERRQRRVLGWLGDNRAAGDERGAELEGQQGHRIVERRNRNHDADRFARHDHLFAGRPGERHLRMDAKTFLRVDIHEIGGSFDFGDCRGERAAEFGCERAA